MLSLKSYKYVYFLHIKSMVKIFKRRFYIKELFFGSVKLTKNADPDKYKYSHYNIGFDFRSELSFTDASMRKNVIIFGVDMSSSVDIDTKNKDILILGERINTRIRRCHINSRS